MAGLWNAGGAIASPNGNPQPGPRFDYKLRWFDRLIRHSAELLGEGSPAVLAGDFNVIPTDLDVYAPERWRDDALFRPEVRSAYHRLLGCARFTDATLESSTSAASSARWTIAASATTVNSSSARIAN